MNHCDRPAPMRSAHQGRPRRRRRGGTFVAATGALGLLAAMTSFAAIGPASAAPTDDLNIGFAGSLVDTTGYTTQGEERMRGVVHRIDGAEEQLATGGVRLDGGAQGIAFEAADFTLTGGAGNAGTTGFVAEVEFTPAGWGDMSTVLSAGGNLFVRSENGRLAYGFDSQNPGGGWSKHRNQADLPAIGEEHALSVRYEADGAGSATLELWLDGEPLPTVTADGQVAVNAALVDTFGFGNEVHPAGGDRGIAGTLSRVRVVGDSDADEPFEFQPTPLATDLLDLGFDGTLAGTEYEPAAGDVLDGALAVRSGTQISGGALVTSAPTHGADFTATEDPFGATALDAGFVTEIEFTPNGEQAELGTVLAVGGNFFARFQNGRFRYGFSSNASGSWQDYVQDVPAPAAGESHVLSLAYDTDADGVTLVAWLDGDELPQVSAPAPSTRSSGAEATLAVGNEFAGQAPERAFAGEIERVRFALLTGPFEGRAFTYQQLDATVCDPIDDLEPGNYISVGPNECAENIIGKANLVRPTTEQLDWQELGLTAFIHFGINTFYNQEWGHGTEDPARFDPTGELDVDQWVQTLRDTGHRLAILVVKHHDGFLSFPSRYSDYSVASTPWQNGEGDILRDFVTAAHTYGMQVGVYMSPADSNQEIEGTFGNGSATTERTIPTLVEGDDRAGEDLPTFTYEATDYGEYFLNTLYEVLTQYGPIDEVWFDGAQGNTAKHETYDYPAFYDMIGELQPDAVVAVGGRDVRWVGTEAGWARNDEWAVVPISNPADGGKIGLVGTSGNMDQALGSRAQIEAAARAGADALHWWPTEADMKLTQGWFAHPNDAPKSGQALLGHYLETTGRNSLMLLNTPPTTTGTFAPASEDALADFAAERRRSFTLDHALGVQASADGEATAAITDGNSRSSWLSGDDTPEVTLDLGAPERVDYVGLSEDALRGGQVVEGVRVDARIDGAWTEVGSAGVVGVQRIIDLDEPVTAQEFRITITRARGPVALASINLWERLDADPGKLTEVHLDPSAPVAGDGSAERPFNHLEQFRRAELAPGASVVLHGGTAEDADVPFWGYGTDDAPITVTVADGDGAPTFGDRTAADVFGPLTAQGWVLDLETGGDGSDGGSDGSDGGSGGSDGSDGGSDGSDGSDGGSDGSDGSDGGSDGSDGSDGGSDGSDGSGASDAGSDGGSDGSDGSDGSAGSAGGADGSDSGSDGPDGTDGSDAGAGSDEDADAEGSGPGSGSGDGSDGADDANVGASGASDAGANPGSGGTPTGALPSTGAAPIGLVAGALALLLGAAALLTRRAARR
ncbi:alpha-L-fucosidase [Pseudactinotalea sp. HY158]|uniref:alpha-L-fucosidase n=1 Tax=Pseudactinotalea sp. HY158 TaxID=2654547 RepID=UPI00129CF683|nr:alpha-L-fucosidase [Pseudactinotalea sp. HY158]QGH69859.1 hypothetical protein GCE65_10345 [Pseudactinotalea sp. HY158]